jgi:hypothetical protein
LISFQNRQRIDQILGRHVAHRRQWIAFLERTVQYHRDDSIAKLPVNRLTVVPVSIHDGFLDRLAGGSGDAQDR